MIKKKQLIREYAKEYGVTVTYATAIFESVFNYLGRRVILDGEDVYMYGFGTIKHRTVKEHRVRHPGTGEMTVIKARDKIVVLPSISWYDETAGIREEDYYNNDESEGMD